ncbi:MAG: MaoC/PaaZ C-terminal domain-containing protein, partial [Saprospiraceae bacterium]
MKELLQRDDIYKESFSFTQEQVELFAKLSMDMNPIHLDADFASKTIFKKPIIHGYLGSS